MEMRVSFFVFCFVFFLSVSILFFFLTTKNSTIENHSFTHSTPSSTHSILSTVLLDLFIFFPLKNHKKPPSSK